MKRVATPAAHGHCRPRLTADFRIEIDPCDSGPITAGRIRKLLAACYDRMLADIYRHRRVEKDEGEELYKALVNCYLQGEEVEDDGFRSDCELARKEIFRRLAYAAARRISSIDVEPTDLVRDLALLDALKDLAEDGEPAGDWTITRECELEFD
jgi:hypothetical protein